MILTELTQVNYFQTSLIDLLILESEFRIIWPSGQHFLKLQVKCTHQYSNFNVLTSLHLHSSKGVKGK